MDKTKIEWCDATWNPVRGCTKVSDGCKFCYAEAMARRFCKPGQWGDGIATRLKGWTGRVALDEEALLRPLRWKKPRRIFVTSLGDPFHGAVHIDWVIRMLAVMALTPQHTYLLLTKRAETMRDFFTHVSLDAVTGAIMALDRAHSGHLANVIRRKVMDIGREPGWPLPNLWLGVSVENQKAADERIPPLLDIPAVVHFVSCEPLLGPVDLGLNYVRLSSGRIDDPPCPQIGWVIAGGESGRHARPMHPDWVRSLRDQCANAGVPFLFKQWGEYGLNWFNEAGQKIAGSEWMDRMGKKAAGRLLDGKIHHEFPKA